MFPRDYIAIKLTFTFKSHFALRSLRAREERETVRCSDTLLIVWLCHVHERFMYSAHSTQLTCVQPIQCEADSSIYVLIGGDGGVRASRRHMEVWHAN